MHKEIDRIMEEKKNELGKVFVEEEGKERGIEIESALVGSFKDGIRALVAKTVEESYVLEVRRINSIGEERIEGLHLSKESMSAVLCSMLEFFEKEPGDIGEFATCCMDDNSGVMYKSIHDKEEDS